MPASERLARPTFLRKRRAMPVAVDAPTPPGARIADREVPLDAQPWVWQIPDRDRSRRCEARRTLRIQEMN
jgi:hypothetical protein